MSFPSTKLKATVLFGISEIPEVGEFLALLVELLWPEEEAKEIAWDELLKQVESMINSKLDEDAYQRLEASLEGIKTNIDEYTNAIKMKLPASKIYANYVAARDDLNQQLPHFQEPTHRWVLLPLFVQAVNLQFALLRDAYFHGAAAMKIGDVELQHIKSSIKDAIKQHSDYATDVLLKAFKVTKIEQIDLRNNLFTQMRIMVTDYMELWPRCDPDSTKPPMEFFSREVFSSVYGVGDVDWPREPLQPGYCPVPPQNARVTRIQVFGKAGMGRPEAMVAWYDDKPGPRMGGHQGWVWLDIDMKNCGGHGKVVGFLLHQVDGISSFGARCADNEIYSTADFGGRNFTQEIPIPEDHYLSSVYVVSVFHDAQRGWLYNDLVRTIWFGYKFEPDVFRKIGDLRGKGRLEARSTKQGE